MQNTSIIRHHADYLLLASHTLNSLNCFDKGHVSVFREEMEEFQQLFKAWVKEIKEMDKEDFEDEWDFFNKNIKIFYYFLLDLIIEITKLLHADDTLPYSSFIPC